MAGSGVTIVIAGQDNTDKVFNQIQANLKRTEERAHETESALSRLGEKGKQSLELIGIALGVREVIASFKEAVHAALEYGEAINDASTKTGLTTETLSVLRYAATQAGVDFEGVSNAVAKMDKTIAAAANGNRQASAILSAIGLNASDLADRVDGAEIAFKRVAQTIGATENPIRRVELATSLFGKSGANLIETLINIGNNWDAFQEKTSRRGLLLSPEMAERLEAANKALKDLDQAARGTSIRLTSALAPAIELITNAFIDATNGGQTWTELGKKIGAFALTTAEDFALLAKYIRLAKAEYDSWSSHIDAIGDKVDSKIGFTASQRAKSQSKYENDIKRSLDAAQEYRNASNDYEKARGAILEAIKKTTEDSSQGKGDLKTKPKPGGFGGAGDVGEQDKLEAARKQRDAALLHLAEQGESLRQQRARNAQEVALAQLENDHKQQLISDEDYYAQKLSIQNASYDQQLAAAKTKIAQINDAISKLQADERRQGAGTSKGLEDASKIADLQTKRLQVEGEIAKIQTQAAKDQKESAQSVYGLARKRLQLSDELAAKVEAQHGLSVDARLKQNDDQYAIEREKLVLEYGANSVEVGNADQIDKARRDRIAASLPEAQSGVDIAGISARRSGVAGARARGAITTLDAKRQMIELDREEARALQPVLEAYQRLADDDGDLEAAKKVVELQEQIRDLNSPIDDVAQNIREGLDGAFEGLFDNIAAGKNALEGFAHDVERILSDAVYKQYVEPLIQNMLAGVMPGASGNGSSLPNAQTAGNPGAVPKGLNAGAILGGLIPGLAKGPATTGNASKGTGMNVTVTLVNDSDTQLKIGDIMKQGGTDLDKFEALFAKSFGSGGIVRQLMMGS
ncbi:coiled-coil domain-containing protein [Edaphobacter albus]|uniref:hypothetical protein n=1 Tax=Edaphobacter sp. 4G125 TaxID=2763071 RepID=UPI001647C05B|nr:hypothetical protein [Edaphobacter sp. 4G125]QNI37527.1 hypothetical protein H7846_04280 [Edaphobacter sp. 4G125]